MPEWKLLLTLTTGPGEESWLTLDQRSWGLDLEVLSKGRSGEGESDKGGSEHCWYNFVLWFVWWCSTGKVVSKSDCCKRWML